MVSHAPFITSADGTGQRDAVPTASSPLLSAWAWTFVLPVAIVWLSLYTVEHSTYFASASFMEKGDGDQVIEATSGSSASRQLSIAAMGAMGAVLLLLPASEPFSANKGLLMLIILMCVLLMTSALWADDPSLSLKRAVQPVLLIVAGLGITKHWQPRQLCLFAAIFSGLMLLVGMAFVLRYGTLWQASPYRFGGTLHPNAQAVNCAALCLASLALFFDSRTNGRMRWWWLAVFVIGLMFLLLTRSRTTTAAFAVGLLAFFFVGASAARKCAIAAIPVAIALFCGLLLVLPDSGGGSLLLGAVQMGRGTEDTASLTGRMPIWKTVSGDIAAHPLLGYGYGSFWTPQRVWEYSFIHHWEFNHAHSAYFETLLNMGIIGLSLGLVILLWTAWNAARQYNKSHDVSYRFIVAMIVVAFIHGAVDSNFVMIGFAPLLIMMSISLVALHSRTKPVENSAAIEQMPTAIPFRTALNY